jgi:hypothetical protein
VRKRIVIGLIVVAGVAVTLTVFSASKKGTVEYHKRNYVEALYARTWRERIHDGWDRVVLNTDRGYSRIRSPQEVERIDTHQRALIRLGYLEERIFTASSVPISNFSYAVNLAMRKKGPPSEFWHVDLSRTNELRVVTPKGNMPTIDEVMQEVGLSVPDRKE